MNSNKDYFTVYMNICSSECENVKYGFDVIDYTLNIVCKNCKNIRWVWNAQGFEANQLRWFISAQEIIYKYSDLASIKQIINVIKGGNFDNLKIVSSKYNVDIDFSIKCVNNQVKETDARLIDINKNNKGKLTINYDTNGNNGSWVEMYKSLSDNKFNRVEFSYNTVVNNENSIITDKEYVSLKENYEDIYSVWSTDSKTTVYEDNFISVVDSLIGKDINLCNGDCRGRVISVDLSGTVSPCFLIDNNTYKINSIFDFHTIKDIFESSQYRRYSFEVQKRMLTDCKLCTNFITCNGGCNAFFLNRNKDISLCDKNYCKSVKSKIIAAYNVFRNIDIYSEENVNFNLTQNLVNKNILTVMEIKNFLSERGIEVEWDYSEDNFMESKEFKLFKLFNMVNNFCDTNSKTSLDNYTRENRNDIISKIYDNFYIDVVNIINLN